MINFDAMVGNAEADNRWKIGILVLLCAAFLGYTAVLYMMPLRTGEKASAEAAAGKLVWQKFNCQSCHQLYGLGGYLGPDLTNIMSQPGKDGTYVKAMIASGTRQMPAFVLTDEEEATLVVFLQSADRSGISDPRHFRTLFSGIVKSK